MTSSRPLAALMVALLTFTAGCSTTSAKVDPAAPDSHTGYTPQTVTACDRHFTMTREPRRVIVINTTGVAELSALGLLDRVVARAGTLDTALYGSAKPALDAIPVMASQKAGGGNSDVSVEALLERKPDLVIGSIKDAGLVAKLSEAGVATYIPQALCGPGGPEKPSLDDAYAEVRRVAAFMGVSDKADAVVHGLRARTEQRSTPPARGTAAAVYVTPGDTKLWGFGVSSMITPKLEANGLKNALGSEKKRSFEVSMETLLQLDPDDIVVVHQEDADAARKTLLAAHGASDLKAVKHGHVVTQPFALTDPPSALSVDGVENIAKVTR